jgi:predicted RNA-binding Zn ribbon-like protein
MWEWLGEALAVDFANTTKRSGDVGRELLRAPEDVSEWARREAGRVPAVAPADVRLQEVRALRDAVVSVLHATVRGDPAPTRAARDVNARLRAVPLVPQLRDGYAVLEPAVPAVPLDELLARVAHSAIELAARGGIGFCDAPSCGQFFEQRRASQRWCSDACGSRARVARHAHRHRS